MNVCAAIDFERADAELNAAWRDGDRRGARSRPRARPRLRPAPDHRGQAARGPARLDRLPRRALHGRGLWRSARRQHGADGLCGCRPTDPRAHRQLAATRPTMFKKILIATAAKSPAASTMRDRGLSYKLEGRDPGRSKRAGALIVQGDRAPFTTKGRRALDPGLLIGCTHARVAHARRSSSSDRRRRRAWIGNSQAAVRRASGGQTPSLEEQVLGLSDALGESQQAWLRYRDDECDRRMLDPRRGTEDPVTRATCRSDLARARIARLRGE